MSIIHVAIRINAIIALDDRFSPALAGQFHLFYGIKKKSSFICIKGKYTPNSKFEKS